MASYALEDFVETVAALTGGPTAWRDGPFLRSEPTRVLAAWGDCPDREGWQLGDWEGGFVVVLADSTRCYITGWCDYTGWGCQDGVGLEAVDPAVPLRDVLDSIAGRRLREKPWAGPRIEWDLEPADLNRWIELGRPALYSAEWTGAYGRG